MSVLEQAQREWLRVEQAATAVDARTPASGPFKLNAIEIREFLALDIPQRDYLLEPILPRQGLVMIHGPRGLGKTHLSLGIAYAVSSGSTFLRWKAHKAAGVLYVDGEMPGRTLQERWAHIVAANEAEPAAPLQIVTPDLNCEHGMPDLSRPDGQAAIDALATDEVQLIIVDNLSCLARSGVENDAESWLALQSWALRHRAAGRSVLFIHHSGKSGAQRGTSRREDVLDTVIGLRKPSDYSPEDGARFEVHYEKARGFHGDTAKPFEAKLTSAAGGATTWVMRNLEDDRASRIAEMQSDGMKPGEIALELGMSRATVYRELKKQNGAMNV